VAIANQPTLQPVAGCQADDTPKVNT
jgi:hypothetical protein